MSMPPLIELRSSFRRTFVETLRVTMQRLYADLGIGTAGVAA
jgi:hypothetical protein